MRIKMTAVLVSAGIAAFSAGAQAQNLLERGQYLVRGISACGSCHTPKGPGPNGEVPGMELAGGFEMKEEAFTAYTPNITPDPETGIGRWTDEQIITAIREGKRPDGSTVGPPMPVGLYRQLSDNDAKAIVAYLRSIPAVKNAVKKSEYRMPLPASYGPPVGSVADVPKSDKLRYGAYVAGPLGHCVECHTPMAEGRRDYANRLGAGGQTFTGPFGVSVAANITPHPEHGIGKWTDEQIKTAVTQGVRSNGEKMKPPMAYGYYKNASAEDLDALVVFLRSLKPIEGVGAQR